MLNAMNGMNGDEQGMRERKITRCEEENSHTIQRSEKGVRWWGIFQALLIMCKK